MSINQYSDEDDIIIKGDDGTEAGQKIGVVSNALKVNDSQLVTTNSSLSAIDAGIPATLGQTTMANSMPVVLSSNHSTIKVVPILPVSLVYEDMNATSGGVARGTSVGTSFVTIYNVSTSGLFHGFDISMQGGLITPNWFYRLTIDSSDIFTATGITSSDLTSSSGYDYGNADDIILGLKVSTGSFKFQPPYPIAFTTNITIQVKRSTGSGNFQAGFVLRS